MVHQGESQLGIKTHRGVRLRVLNFGMQVLDRFIIWWKVEDKDSGKYGQVRFALESENSLATPYFQIDGETGIVSTRRMLSDISPGLKHILSMLLFVLFLTFLIFNFSAILPFRFSVLAKDNLGVHPSLVTVMELIVNLIAESHRMIVIVEVDFFESSFFKEMSILLLLLVIYLHIFNRESLLTEWKAKRTSWWKFYRSTRI